MKIRSIITKFTAILLGILTGQLLARALSTPIVNPSRYIDLHDNKGLSKVECLFYVALGCVTGAAAMVMVSKM